MVRVDNIKAVVYNKNSIENEIVNRFLFLDDKEFYQYDDENSLDALIAELKGKEYHSKEVVILKEFKGRLFQKCPGSKTVICCNYLVINTCFDCLYNCAYCFLNSYLNSYGIVQFTNVLDVIDEIKSSTDLRDDLIYRVGTGEFTDSLMFDEITGIAASYIDKMSSQKNIMLEFKTKSNNIEHLFDLKSRGNTVLSWSLNTERNIRLYEQGTATLKERIEAARKASVNGYYVAFHFDPIIMYDNFMDEYHNIIDEIFSSIDNEKVVWISLGCFRHSPGFKEIIREKFPDERLTVEEMFPCPDGKMRYLKKNRLAVYGDMKKSIESHSKKPFVYLCMESSDVWKTVFNYNFNTSEDLEEVFSNHIRDNFNLLNS